MIALIAAVVLGGAFGAASATVESLEDTVMVVDIEVEVLGAGDSVVAHLSLEDSRFTLPLIDRGEGVFGLRTELEPRNYAVVFEVVGAEGESSEPTSLQEMGADLGRETAATTTTTVEEEEEGLSESSQRMLWLAIALGAGSLSLLAFWVLGGRDEEEEQSEDGVAAEEE